MFVQSFAHVGYYMLSVIDFLGQDSSQRIMDSISVQKKEGLLEVTQELVMTLMLPSILEFRRPAEFRFLIADVV